jgi:hypothetical protein
MRTSDPSVMTQVLFQHLTSSKYQAAQHTGSYIGIITDTHTNNPQIPVGTVKFSVPQFGADSGWPPAPFPGTVDPPLGTQCVVTFEGQFGNSPRVVTFTSWQSPRIWYQTSDPRVTTNSYVPTVGDMWVSP